MKMIYDLEVMKKPPEYFDAVEIHGVHEDALGNCEPTSDANDVSFYSVYVHYGEAGNKAQNFGVECVADFSDHNEAVQYANELAAQLGISELDDYTPIMEDVT